MHLGVRCQNSRRTVSSGSNREAEGNSLKHAAQEHKADREIALEAVKQHGYALEYAAPSREPMLEVGRHTATQLGGPPGAEAKPEQFSVAPVDFSTEMRGTVGEGFPMCFLPLKRVRISEYRIGRGGPSGIILSRPSRGFAVPMTPKVGTAPP